MYKNKRIPKIFYIQATNQISRKPLPTGVLESKLQKEYETQQKKTISSSNHIQNINEWQWSVGYIYWKTACNIYKGT